MKKPDWTSLITLGSSGIIIIMAVAVISGWEIHNLPLVNMGFSYAPMQFNTALCFLLCASALITLHTGARLYTTIASCAAMAISLLTLSEYLLGRNWGIDTLFVQPFTTTNVVSPGRMAPNTSLGFMLAGSALYLCVFDGRLSLRRAFTAALIGSLIVALGAVPLLGYVFGIAAAYIWGNFIHMALHTSLCFLLLGIVVIVHTRKASHQWEQWLPIPIFIGLAAAAIALSGAVRNQEDNEFAARVQVEANHISYEAQSRLAEMYNAIDRIASRWQDAGGTPQNLWDSDAKAYLQGYPFLAGISVTDENTVVKWLETRENIKNNKALGFRLTSEPIRAATVKRVLDSKASQTSPAIELLTGGKGFLFISPLYSHDHFDGLQVSVFRMNEFFGGILDKPDFHKLYVTVEDGQTLFSDLPAGASHAAAWRKEAKFENRGTAWTIAVSPTPQMLEEKNSLIPIVILITGFFTSLLVTLCFFLALKWRQNAQTLRARELALEELNSVNNAVLSSAAYMIVATNMDGLILLFNPEAERTLGYTAQEVIGKKTPAIWHDKEEVRQRAIEMSQESGEVIEPGFEVMVRNARVKGSEEKEWIYRRKDGTRFPANLNVTPLTDSTGKVVGYLGIIQDITLRRRQEEALKKSEETFRLALEHASIGMALVSPTGMFVQVNKALCDIVGYSKAELLKLDFQTITHPEDLNVDLAYFYQMLAGDIETYQMEKRYIHKRGHIVDIMLSVSLVRNANNTPAYFISQIQDITERKQAELELKASEGFNRSLMGASADCVMMLDTDGRMVNTNLPGLELLEADDTAMLTGNDWALLWPADGRAEIRNAMKVALGGSQYRFQGFCPTVKGKPKWWDVQVSPVWNAAGKVVNILSVSRDITQGKQVEVMKTEFISTVSHELRTPLTSIRGSLGLVTAGVMGVLPEKVQALVQIAYNNSERLVRLINNILDIEKIESGRMTFERRPVTVSALLRQSIQETEGFAAKYGIALVLEDGSKGALVMGDQDRLLQVLGNLLSNAIKYSPSGGRVILSGRRTANGLRISAEDNGAGIPEDFKSRIFGKFAQADSSDTRQKGGTGLGLSISRTIIESMDGTLDFESRPGRTEFYFTLPALSPADVVEVAPQVEMKETTILICEDEPDIAALLKLILQKEGFMCDIAANAAEAKRLLAVRHYACMTLDLALPDEDGLALIRELRQNEKTVSLPIVVISARAAQGKITLGGDAIGILDWLPKPIDFERLKRVLGAIPHAPMIPSILHVEDDEDIARVITASLEGKAHVTYATTLAEARTMLVSHHFDLAILDMRLPDGSGTDLLPALSEQGLPVVILSVDEPSRDIQRQVAASLVKSQVTEDKILKTIRRYMRINQEEQA